MKEKLNTKDILTIPNLLSLIRILLVPVFVWQYFADFKNHYYYAGGTIILSGLTDMLDGIIARSFNMISTFGKMLDPFADKLTQGVIVACLTIQHPVLLPLLILFCAKEFSMLAGSIVLLKKGLRPSEAKWWGKLATFVIYVLLLVVLISDIFDVIPDWALILLSIVAAVCILFSLISYYPIFKNIMAGNYDIESEQMKQEQ